MTIDEAIRIATVTDVVPRHSRHELLGANAVLAAEVGRLMDFLNKIEAYPSTKTLSASTRAMALLAQLAKGEHKLAQKLLAEFDQYRRYVNGLDAEIVRIKKMACDGCSQEAPLLPNGKHDFGDGDERECDASEASGT